MLLFQKAEVEVAVKELKRLKEELEKLELSLQKPKFDRAGFESLMKRRFFFVSAFEIYNGKAGTSPTCWLC